MSQPTALSCRRNKGDICLTLTAGLAPPRHIHTTVSEERPETHFERSSWPTMRGPGGVQKVQSCAARHQLFDSAAELGERTTLLSNGQVEGQTC